MCCRYFVELSPELRPIVEENTVLRKWYERNGAVHIGTEKFDFFPFTCGYMRIALLPSEQA